MRVSSPPGAERASWLPELLSQVPRLQIKADKPLQREEGAGMLWLAYAVALVIESQNGLGRKEPLNVTKSRAPFSSWCPGSFDIELCRGLGPLAHTPEHFTRPCCGQLMFESSISSASTRRVNGQLYFTRCGVPWTWRHLWCPNAFKISGTFAAKLLEAQSKSVWTCFLASRMYFYHYRIWFNIYLPVTPKKILGGGIQQWHLFSLKLFLLWFRNLSMTIL